MRGSPYLEERVSIVSRMLNEDTIPAFKNAGLTEKQQAALRPLILDMISICAGDRGAVPRRLRHMLRLVRPLK